MSQKGLSKVPLFPFKTEVDGSGHLCIGGCDVIDLTQEFGTPLYVFDEFTLRSRCREFKFRFSELYSETLVLYASKAFLNQALAVVFKEEGLGLDVVSGGELSIAQSVRFPQDKVYFHGNNKTLDELTRALNWGIGRVVVDNIHELHLVDGLAKKLEITQPVLLRLNPGVDPHTHRHTTTGILDSKFGFPIATSQAAEAVAQAMAATNLDLVGLHFHLGSPIHDVEPYELAIDIVLRFASEMKNKYGFRLREFSPGGGFAVQYTIDSPVLSVSNYAEAIVSKFISVASQLGLDCPELVIEPGRGIVAQAGVALYAVGAIKTIPNVRNYVCIDGGMGDNIRPALYGAKYEAVLANKVLDEESTKATIAGRYCESGDILAKDVALPPISAGDVIAVPVCGAYCMPMSSNYNLVPRPAIVMVSDGKARLIRKRESYQDLLSWDMV